MYDIKAKDKANTCDIGAILRTYGHDPSFVRKGKVRLYHSPFHEDKNPSLSVDHNNMWADFGDTTGKLKGDAINLVEYLGGLCYLAAVSHIFEIMGMPYYSDIVENTKITLEKKEGSDGTRVIAVRTIQDPAVQSYLESRGIPESIYSKYLSEIVYFCGKEYTSMCLRTDGGGYAVRGLPMPGTRYPDGIKRFIGPSNPSTIHVNGDSYSQQCLVFEGQMDMLSWVAMYGDPMIDMIVLNSVTTLPKLAGLAAKGVCELYCNLDADADGRKATAEMADVTGCAVHDCSSLYAGEGVKDVNEYLIKVKGLKRKK